MPYKSKHRPLQQQPVRQYDAQQQQSGSTSFQPRAQAGRFAVQTEQQLGGDPHSRRTGLKSVQSSG